MSTSSPSNIRVSREGAVAHLQLRRPESLNAWTPHMGREVLAALRELGADDAVRCVLISGAGRGFCAGADVKVPRETTTGGDMDLTSRLRDIYNPIIVEVRRMPKPVVVAVHGAAAGLGFSLAAAADLVIAAETARFLLAFVHIAVMPDGGALPHLVAKAGLGRATELAMLGEKLPAARAAEYGIVNRVVPDEDLQTEAAALADRLAAMPTVALASMKDTLNEAVPDLEGRLAREADRQQRHATTHDYVEGVTAFKEKRRAHFLGR